MPFPPLCYVAKCVRTVNKIKEMCPSCFVKHHCPQHRYCNLKCEDCLKIVTPLAAPGIGDATY
jgi:hypothetical protein